MSKEIIYGKMCPLTSKFISKNTII